MATTILTGPRRAPTSGQSPKGLVVSLHGYGSNGDDLISLAPYWDRLLPDVQFSSPNAPTQVPGFGAMYQWFAIESMDPVHLAKGAKEAAPLLEAFLEAEMARFNVTKAQTALVGFSQGTMMALQVGLASKEPYAGILGYSGALVGNPEIASKPPVLLVHGDQDDVVPLMASQMAQQFLSKAGLDARLHVSPRATHTIAMDGLQLGGAFLARVLKGA
ncbi:prolyl oligopeptidase family serine peptidase [Aquidulcibacter sp.]|uniref:alpha/beta hydrolase n=1 Tax=Aquidulcibacter sp. TaxID=2052990 RepID=UPI0025C1A2B5|nr:prolyl oligopeptidase family serine peptidase [Aquidulcibacter sp.]MCA3697786.1 prolyl oligopeptidase family serine peptidase [Aquidulcibacter sp.]